MNRQNSERVVAGDVEQFCAIFAKIKLRFDEQNHKALLCKQGFYDGCSVLKLQKASWTNDPMDRVQNTSGIFFSVWVSQESIRKNRANYNIHALKLRQLAGYSITARNFADDFRNGLAAMRNTWPNMSTDYGPQTLMQGWIEIDFDRFERDIHLLLKRFLPVSKLIDRLVEARRKEP